MTTLGHRVTQVTHPGRGEVPRRFAAPGSVPCVIHWLFAQALIVTGITRQAQWRSGCIRQRAEQGKLHLVETTVVVVVNLAVAGLATTLFIRLVSPAANQRGGSLWTQSVGRVGGVLVMLPLLITSQLGLPPDWLWGPYLATVSVAGTLSYFRYR